MQFRVRALVLATAAGLLWITSAAAQVVSAGAGGGGWLQAGTFHPTNPDVILVGADISGVYRSDDAGQSWRAWNAGLTTPDLDPAFYVDDLIGIEHDGWVGFFAATQAGIYRTGESGPWEWVTPAGDGFTYDNIANWRPLTIPFSCLDWNGGSLLVAGSGRVRWNTNFETTHYPGLPDSLFAPYPPATGIDEQFTVWTLDLTGPSNDWQGSLGSNFGAARDITTRNVLGNDMIAVATPRGIHWFDGSQWHDVGAPLYAQGLSCWSLHLTPRGALYGAFQKAGSAAGGVYRIPNINFSTAWQWVGDGSLLGPGFTHSLQDIGSGPADLVWLTVVDGRPLTAEPDVLFLAARAGNDPHLGVYKCELLPSQASAQATWTHKVYRNGGTFFQVDGAGVELPLDPGYLDAWSSGLIFPPVISRSDPSRVLIHLNTRLHLSENAGDNWNQSYTEDVGGAWRSRGYNELVVAGLAFLPDGRVVEGTGDVGTLLSTDRHLTEFEYIRPGISSSATPADDLAWDRESSSVAVRPGWMGRGDAIFVNIGDVIQRTKPCKLFRFDPSDQRWYHITSSLNSDRFLFGDFTFSDDATCFLAYTEFDRGVAVSGKLQVDVGVMRGDYVSDGNWTWTKINDGLLYDPPGLPSWNVHVGDLMFDSLSGRILLAGVRAFLTPGNSTVGTNLDVPGALFLLDSATDATWQHVFGGNGVYGGPVTNWRDFQVVAQSTDGSVWYAGASGVPNAWGGVLINDDPSGDPMNWVSLTEGNPMGFVPPSFVPWTPEVASHALMDVRGLAVSPWDPSVVFASLHDPGALPQEGLWAYNRFGGGQWEQLSTGTPMEGMSALSLEFHPYDPGKLVVGTAGQELYWIRVDSTDVVTATPAPAGADGLTLLGTSGNPSQNGVTVAFALARRGEVVVDVFDVRGRRVDRFSAGRRLAGRGEVTWPGSDFTSMASGVYFLRIQAAGVARTVKVALVR